MDDPRDTTGVGHGFPRTGVALSGIELGPVTPGAWRVLDRTAREDCALLGIVITAGSEYQVIAATALGRRSTFPSIEAARASFTDEGGAH